VLSLDYDGSGWTAAGERGPPLGRLQAAYAEAALEGWLRRGALRAISEEAALDKLCTLPGIGPFFSQGILYRGAGLADAVTDDEMTRKAFQRAFELPRLPEREAMLKLAEPWRPYRMWATVLLHVSLRRETGGTEGIRDSQPTSVLRRDREYPSVPSRAGLRPPSA